MSIVGDDEEPGVSAVQYLPARLTLESLKKAALGCRGCPLFKNATQTVFGEGRSSARLLLVGEQPGNEEDLTGRPFVGPAGKLLERGLEAAGTDRRDAWSTIAAKHCKCTPSGG